jgi:alkyl hydroperoxide reductase subunit F
LKTRTIIIATGSKPRKLNVLGEAEYSGKGVAYCAICDGPLFKDKEVVVAGGGNSAVEAAIDLSKVASRVKLVQRSVLRAEKALVDKLTSKENVEIYLGTHIKEIYGDKLVKGIKVYNKEKDEYFEINADGVFVEIGYIPNSEPFKDLVKTLPNGEIEIDCSCRTNVDGIFAAGDVTTVPYKQISISSGEGAKAALSANAYINKLKK